MIDASGYLRAVVGSDGVQADIAQIRAKSVLHELGMPVETVNWRYIPARIVRNLSGALVALESISGDPGDLAAGVPFARRLAQGWEALAQVEEGTTRRTAWINSAAAYELAGYQANAACLARKALPVPFTSGVPEWEDAVLLFLQRLVVRLANQIKPATSRPSATLDTVDQLTSVAATATAMAAMSRICDYLLQGNTKALSDARELLDLARRGFIAAGRASDANLAMTVKQLLSAISARSTWSLLRPVAPANHRWERYLRLLARGPGPIIERTPSVSELWPSQIEALRGGLITSNESKVVRMPTSAGKTRIAEIAIAHTLVTERGAKVLYVAPYRALVGEVEEALRAVITDLGYQATSVVGTYELDELLEFLDSGADLLVLTPERLDLIVRTAPEQLSAVRLVVIDEGHLVSDAGRGVKFEWLISRLRRRLTSARFLFLSAVVPDQSLKEFSRWLASKDSAILQSDWRPAIARVATFRWRQERGFLEYERGDDSDTLREFVPAVVRVQQFEITSSRGRILQRRFPDTSSKSQTAAELAIKFGELGSVLVFCTQRNFVEAVGSALETRAEYERATRGLPGFMQLPNERAIATVTEWLGADHLVTRLLRIGVALHHGRLPDGVRRVIETEVRSRRARIVVATNTLAQGVNLPIRTVIIHTCRRREGDQSVRMSNRDYWNIAGRAGRAREETDGTVVHIVNTSLDQSDFQFFQRTRSNLTPVRSALLAAAEEVVRRRLTPSAFEEMIDPEVLALMVEEDPDQLIAGGIDAFIQSTLAGVQAEGPAPLQALRDACENDITRIAADIPNAGLRRVYSATGLSSRSAQAISDYCTDDQDALRSLISGEGFTEMASLLQLALDACEFLPEMEPSSSFGGSQFELLQAWVSGASMAELVDRFGGEVAERQDLGRFIDEYFSYLMPWGLSAFLRIAPATLEVADARWPLEVAFLPSMIKLGLPTPEAVWAFTIGLSSRSAAVRVATLYAQVGGPRDYHEFVQWARSLEPDDMDGLDPRLAEEAALAFGSVGRNPLMERLPVLEHLPFETYVAGLRRTADHGALSALREGSALNLVREYDNSVDRNAVLVMHRDARLGYLPRDVAQWLAPDIDTGLHLRCTAVSMLSRPV